MAWLPSAVSEGGAHRLRWEGWNRNLFRRNQAKLILQPRHGAVDKQETFSIFVGDSVMLAGVRFL